MIARFGLRNTVDRVLLFVLTFAALLTWTLAIARYGGPDEPAHVLRAASVASGEWVGSQVPGLAPGFRAVTVPGALATGDPSCFRHDARHASACAAATAVSGTRRAASSAGTYPPWYYAIVGMPVRWFGNPAAAQSYRIVAALWCAIVLVAAMVRSRRFARSGLVLGALSPAAWFLFGVVNPNSLEIALMLLAWVGVVALRRHRADLCVGELLWFSVPAGLAILIRPIAVVAWLVMVCVLYLNPAHRRAMSPSWSWRTRLAAFGAPLAAIAATLLWGWWSGTQVSDQRTASKLSMMSSLWHSVRGTGQTLRELAGSLGWLEFSSPTWTQVVWWLVVAAAMGALWRKGFGSWMTVAALLLVTPIAFETLFAHRIGFVWQGRYSISVALGLIVLAIDRPLRHESSARRSALVISAATFVIEVATFAYVLRRYTVGVTGSALYRNAGWQPPIVPIVLVGLNAVVMVGLLAVRQRNEVAR